MTITRRALLKSSALLGLYGSAFTTAHAAEDTAIDQSMTLTKYGDPAAADAWLTKWTTEQEKISNAVENPLVLGRFADRMYYLRDSIKWTPNPGQTFPAVEVPKGFVTDFASIPRALWAVLPSDGNYVYGAIIHDYLYWQQTTTRDVADGIFRAAMQDFALSSLVITPIYRAVRVGGWVAWNGNARLKTAGEKRLLKSFPTAPTTKWSDWKKNSTVFA